MNAPREPTPDECSNHSQIASNQWACWYPQMGGYVGRAIAIVDNSGCIDVWVWHNGEFPFSGEYPRFDEDRSPVCIHHCDPEQFISFGGFLNSLPVMQ